MNTIDILDDIIHHKNGIIFQINQIEECLLILKSMSEDKEKLNSGKFSNYFAFTENLIIEKMLLSLGKIYDQYEDKDGGNKVRSIRQLIKFLEKNPNLYENIKLHSYTEGSDNKRFLKNFNINEIKSNEEFIALIKNENPLDDRRLRNKFTQLRNKYLAHNEQHFTISNNNNLDWSEFYELLDFAKDCIHTISWLYLNIPCYFNGKFIQLYSSERTEYCFQNVKNLIPEK
ncbi:hypothetical protein CRV08_09345 [Halarcobacter ebronensis]|uniref:HEPN AbiU2-like domain-containing protein n=1 Tax=Halarcobacter ebronensis TaxID=1462615 RepID=A0A4Q0YD62_9BACT|nr:hypothetical protein [Halarcobacter ebronensis]RXJ68003.1 hypothetical protein CRV08_09345 [Halarcobacter ebronensis]